MKVTGIIAEYNPFHNGHQYHLERAKALTGADAVVVIMSGPVTQRGEAALCDKWSRAEMAVRSGADLVLELPFAFACNSAEEFARGGVSILNGLGCVADLVFGCESDPEIIIAMAKASAEQEERFSELIRSGLDDGLSYPVARGRAMLSFCDPEAIASLDRPNDILAAEYVRQIVLQRSQIVPHGVMRRGSYHDTEIRDEETKFSSATAVRQAVMENRWDDVGHAVPDSTRTMLKVLEERNELTGLQKSGMDLMILSHLLHLGPEGIRNMHGCAEGLEYRLWNVLSQVTSVDELLKETASGRYPTARLRRLLVHSLVGLTKDRFEQIRMGADQGELYARVLACSETGAKLLKKIKKTEGTIPVYTNLNRELSDDEKKILKGERICEDGVLVSPAVISLALDVRAGNFLQMGCGKRLYDGSDFVKCPYIAHKNEKNHK